jgi:hypothetical protein
VATLPGPWVVIYEYVMPIERHSQVAEKTTVLPDAHDE